MAKRLTESQGHALTAVAVQILLSLTRANQHGYGIKLDIEERTGGAVNLGSGTLYQAIQRLERQGFIAEAERSGDQDPRRGRYYRLQPAGRSALEAELLRWDEMVRYARDQAVLPDPNFRS
jgi:DNA-binding PadR family transcriptional regulator